VRISSLVPHGTLYLLYERGMNQFKDVFPGAGKRSTPSDVGAEMRARGGKHNDLENVGLRSASHVFEMLGNFSFGDYFKKDAIAYAWN